MDYSIDVEIHPGIFKSERFVVVKDYLGKTREIIVDETCVDEKLGRAYVSISNIEGGYKDHVCAHFPSQDGDTVMVLRAQLHPITEKEQKPAVKENPKVGDIVKVKTTTISTYVYMMYDSDPGSIHSCSRLRRNHIKTEEIEREEWTIEI